MPRQAYVSAYLNHVLDAYYAEFSPTTMLKFLGGHPPSGLLFLPLWTDTHKISRSTPFQVKPFLGLKTFVATNPPFNDADLKHLSKHVNSEYMRLLQFRRMASTFRRVRLLEQRYRIWRHMHVMSHVTFVISRCRKVNLEYINKPTVMQHFGAIPLKRLVASISRYCGAIQNLSQMDDMDERWLRKESWRAFQELSMPFGSLIRGIPVLGQMIYELLLTLLPSRTPLSNGNCLAVLQNWSINRKLAFFLRFRTFEFGETGFSRNFFHFFDVLDELAARKHDKKHFRVPMWSKRTSGSYHRKRDRILKQMLFKIDEEQSHIRKTRVTKLLLKTARVHNYNTDKYFLQCLANGILPATTLLEPSILLCRKDFIDLVCYFFGLSSTGFNVFAETRLQRYFSLLLAEDKILQTLSWEGLTLPRLRSFASQRGICPLLPKTLLRHRLQKWIRMASFLNDNKLDPFYLFLYQICQASRDASIIDTMRFRRYRSQLGTRRRHLQQQQQQSKRVDRRT